MADARANVLITAQDRATRVLRGVKNETIGLSKAFRALSVALPASLFVAATRSALNFADRIADVSEQTAFSAESLQALKFQAGQNGVAFNELAAGLGRFTKRLGLARAGTGAAAKTYKQLGIDLGQTNEQVFRQVVATLGEMDNETNRLALSTRLFGDDAQRLGVVFAGGVQDLDAYAQKARDLGLILSDELVQGASDANDQLDILQQVVQVQVTRGLVSLAPIITEVGQGFADAAIAVGTFWRELSTVDAADVVNARLKRLATLREKEAELQNRLASGGFVPSGQLQAIQNLIKTLDDSLKAPEFTPIGGLPGAPAPRPRPSPPAVDTGPLFGGGGAGGGGGRGAASGSAAERAAAEALSEAERQQRAFVDSFKSLEAQLDPVTAKTEQYLADVELLNRAWSEGLISGERLEQLMLELATGTEAVADKTKQASDLWQELGPTFESAFEDAIVAGGDLRDVLDGLEQDIIRIFSRELVSKPLTTALGGFLQGQGGFLGSLFGGPRAGGGNMAVGRTYLAGERGPELITMGGNGRALNARDTAALGATHVTVNVHGVSDAQSFQRNRQQVARAAGQALQEARR